MKTPNKDKILPPPMSTISEVMELLKERGLYHEFVFSAKEGMQAFGTTYKAEDLTLIKTYRFEGMSDPGDNSTLYLLEDKEGNIGFILDAYGSESNYGSTFIEFLKAIPVQEHID